MLALSALALFVVGMLYLGALSSFTTIAQLRVTTEIRGRVLAVFTVILGAALPPRARSSKGKIADSIGLRHHDRRAGLMLVVLIVTRLVRPGITAAIDTPVTEPAVD